MLKLFICDDNTNTIGYIEKIIRQKFPKKLEIYTISSIRDLEATVYEDVIIPDIIIIDIHLKDGNACMAIKKIISRYPKIKIIYLSGDNTYKHQAIFSSTSFFVDKPLNSKSLAELIMAIDKSIKLLTNGLEDCVIFKFKKVDYKVKESDIVSVHSQGRKVVLDTINGDDYKTNMKLDEFCTLLSDNFVRIHQRYVVNIEYIKLINNNYVHLLNDTSCPISQKEYHREVCSKFAKMSENKK